MLALAKAFQRAGAEVTMGCSAAFENAAVKAGLGFWEVNINRNANTGIVSKTSQDESEAKRIAAFIEATRSGAAATLIFQAEHRKADMFADPQALQTDILHLMRSIQPDLFVVDQLSYGVSLVLHANELPFLTFCPGHPTYIPSREEYFGVPYAWPEGFEPSQSDMDRLKSLAVEVDRRFTAEFNHVLSSATFPGTGIDGAFRLTSSSAVLFNYPDFGHLHNDNGGPEKIFMGACFNPQPLDDSWRVRLKQHARKEKVLISLGTFLSARADVLERLIILFTRYAPDAALYVAAGSSQEQLSRYNSDCVVIEEFLPQTGLLPYIDMVFHHAGNNSFTETLYYGKPAVALPFSSDQFSIAHDIEKFNLGQVLNPNNITAQEFLKALEWARTIGKETVRHWREVNAPLGPEAAAHRALAAVGHKTTPLRREKGTEAAEFEY
jgi:UDP:flavonoid glycosyltransferase YjiC (YdhE family)